MPCQLQGPGIILCVCMTVTLVTMHCVKNSWRCHSRWRSVSVTDSRPIPVLLHWHNVRTSLHLASMIEHQRQYLHHIWWIEVATYFLSDSLGLLRNLSNSIRAKIPNDIAALTLTFSVNVYLDFDVDLSFETKFVYCRRNFVLITLLNLQTANPFSAVPKINVFRLRLNVVTTAATYKLKLWSNSKLNDSFWLKLK